MLRKVFSPKALNVQLYSFFNIFFGFFKGFTLRSHIEFRTSCNKKVIFFCYSYEKLSHGLLQVWFSHVFLQIFVAILFYIGVETVQSGSVLSLQNLLYTINFREIETQFIFVCRFYHKICAYSWLSF
ncbi:predicted protein [Methanosarcina acetivorans C2A]|uniref:Uncharacterized protein n=1 Tax=Methanosarcina acetivorans (strain ATCC 35395 / DSM 2834 / JCM 12185 / C2A) TaxID=188937 RepID=Q8TS24_METAC|nr:predicted protein [Methanosarcina acetivorans C2A]